MDKNISMHISDRGHMNLTLNIYHCGNTDIREPVVKQTDYYMLYYVHEGNGTISGNGICHSLQPGYVFGVFPNGERTIKAEYGSCINVTWITAIPNSRRRFIRRNTICSRRLTSLTFIITIPLRWNK